MTPNMNQTVPIDQAMPAAVSAPVRRATDKRLLDASETLLDDDVMRANWAVPWSDLMMIMFVLFAALLAAQTMKGQAEREKIIKQEVATPIPTPTLTAPPTPELVADGATSSTPNKSIEPLTRINVLARSREAVRESNLQNVEIVLLEDQSVKVSVNGPMFFALGDANLRPEMKSFLDRLAQITKQTPYDIHIVGHTDDRAINTNVFPSNWELSLLRASNVARYLIATGGIDPARFMVIGRGEYAPVSANTDEQSRALNRRVEIIFTRDVGKAQGATRP